MASNPAHLERIRAGVESALGDFIGQRRRDLASMSEDLVPCADAITDLLAGGKRLRAAFCYWGWRACGGADCRAIFAAAAALELLHASALVHDDLIDASDTRRGKPSVHRRFAAIHAAAGWRGAADAFGASAAILVGDLLLAWTDEMLRTSGLQAAAVRDGMSVLDAMRTEVFAGQFLDLVGQAAATWRLDSALRVVTYKSAKYTVERPLHLGVALAYATDLPAASPGQAGWRQPDLRQAEGGRLPPRWPDPRWPDQRAGIRHPGDQRADQAAVIAAFTGYGIPLGIAFQLRDDILGVFGDPAKTGKPVSDDLRQGKRTVLLAIARARADAEQALALEQIGDPLLTDAAAEQVRAIITSTDALAECELMIDDKVDEALSALDSAPIAAESKAALADLAVAATSRAD